MTALITILACFLAADPSGREIMDANKQRHEVSDEDRTITMTLVDRRGRTKERVVRMMNTKTGEGLEKLMLVFLEPRDVAGTGLLTWEQKARDDDQWLYLPSLEREKRISGGSKKNSFMGTDFSYEDLRVENLDKHTYTVIGEDAIDGEPCWLVQAVISDAKELRSSGYSRRVLWIRQDVYFTARVEYYDKKDRKIKILDNTDIVEVDGGALRSNSFAMKDLKKKTRTEMKVLERKVSQGLDESDFTLRKLKSF